MIWGFRVPLQLRTRVTWGGSQRTLPSYICLRLSPEPRRDFWDCGTPGMSQRQSCNTPTAHVCSAPSTLGPAQALSCPGSANLLHCQMGRIRLVPLRVALRPTPLHPASPINDKDTKQPGPLGGRRGCSRDTHSPGTPKLAGPGQSGPSPGDRSRFAGVIRVTLPACPTNSYLVGCLRWVLTFSFSAFYLTPSAFLLARGRRESASEP